MKVTVPDKYTGRRYGRSEQAHKRVSGMIRIMMESCGEADVPMAEIYGYYDLRSMTEKRRLLYEFAHMSRLQQIYRKRESIRQKRPRGR